MKNNENELIKDIGIERYNHSQRVIETAVKLGEIYNVDMKKVKEAALYHDCGKIGSIDDIMSILKSKNIKLSDEDKKSPEVVHTKLGAYLAQNKYNVVDEDVLNAIKYHTTGRAGMSLLEKIIYIADYIEPKREFPGVEVVRKESKKNLDKSILTALENTINYLKSKNEYIHKDTIDAYNFINKNRRSDILKENTQKDLKTLLEAASDKKAYNFKLIDISKISSIADYFLICSAGNTKQAEAIADNIVEKMSEKEVKINHKEGYRAGKWILLDYNHIVVHIFVKEERDKYNLEKIWLDGKDIDVENFGIENWS
ncbi:MAG: bis(5'-nucleosyl)-tetraphosphatase (symmetrical) YqeK [Bacillota bacterium]|nr:bis(5'-nucleosyl)-tetraphosphatase (symmetrical) YqeK [Bacillota bacterium]